MPALNKEEGTELLLSRPWEWRLEHLQALIDNRSAEDLHIEYKESRLFANKDNCVEELTKTVSAFNNSDGGVMIIGMKEGREGKKRYPDSFDEGVCESDFNKTWLVQIINSNINPSIPDLRVNLVKLHGEQEGKVVCVIYVPKGTRAVQAKDLRYYQRIEDQSVPMRDFQIRDVNNRSLGPDLWMCFIIPPGQSNELITKGGLVAWNLSDTVVELAVFRIVVPKRLEPSVPRGFVDSDISPSPRIRLQYKRREISDDSKIYVQYYRSPESHPIFKGLQPTVVGDFDITFRACYENIPHSEPLLWIAESPRMGPRYGASIVTTDGWRVELNVAQEARITLDGIAPLDYLRQPTNITTTGELKQRFFDIA
jgi:hypothetical protein